MILHALADYYQRLVDDPDIDVAPPGFERKAIDFAIVLSSKGTFENIVDLREGTGKKSRGRISLVPKGVKKASGIAANLLWDSPAYVLGKSIRCDKKSKLKYKKIERKKILQLSASKKEVRKLQARSEQQHAAFCSKIKDTFAGVEDVGLKALMRFFEIHNYASVFQHPIWNKIEENGGNITFMLAGDSCFLCQREALVRILQIEETPGEKQVCSVSGNRDIIANLHTAIKGVWGAQTSGANIVSFNLDAFRSHGKKQGFNAPVGQSVEFAYTTALNYLLASEQQRMQIGDASTVFWAQEMCDLEEDFYAYLAPPKGEAAQSYDKIRGLMSAVQTGIPPEEGDIPFFVLGLSPNAARIAIRFWYEGNVREMKERIAQHFKDVDIITSPNDSEFLSLFQILVSTATENKADNIPPNLGGELARAVFSGTPYPRTLFANAIRRCKAEQRISRSRAAIIKAFLVRQARKAKSDNQEVGMALDKEYGNIGYVLGRLFALLERIQEQAHEGGLNKTIRDTYFGSAASSPLVTFKRLDNLSVHHLAKIRNKGKSVIWWEQQKQEIYGHIPPTGIPSILNMEDQGRFAVGYYHQRQDYFTKKENKVTEA